MPATILPFARPAPPAPEPVRVTVFVNDTLVAHETLTAGGAFLAEVVARPDDWTVWLGRRRAKTAGPEGA